MMSHETQTTPLQFDQIYSLLIDKQNEKFSIIWLISEFLEPKTSFDDELCLCLNIGSEYA